MINADTSLGNNIRAFRKMKGKTVEELAEAVGISESHLKKIESGTRQNLNTIDLCIFLLIPCCCSERLTYTY